MIDTSLLEALYIPEPNSGCWLWLGTANSQGYGTLQDDGLTIRAHRVVYEAEVGPIPEGLVIDHLCRNRICVNPSHLEPVTFKENVLRGISPPANNARKTHCPRGHALSEPNVNRRRGYRACVECERVQNAARQRRFKARKRGLPK